MFLEIYIKRISTFATITIFNSIDTRKPSSLRAPSEQWSGEATRMSGFAVEDTRVDVTIGDESPDDNTVNHRKETPIWMTESTILNPDGSQVHLPLSYISFIDPLYLFCELFLFLNLWNYLTQLDVNTQESILDKAAATATNTSTTNNKQGEDIMSVLLAHEKKGGTNSTAAIKAALPQESSDSSDNEEEMEMQAVDTGIKNFLNNRTSDIGIAGRSMRTM